MKDKDLKNYNKAIIATVLLLIIIIVFFRKSFREVEVGDDEGVETAVTQGSNKTSKIPSTDDLKNLPPLATIPPAQVSAALKASTGFNKERYDYIVRQHVRIKKFKEKIKLKINLPKNLDYVDMDMEDNIAGLYGSNLKGDKSFVVLATTGDVSMKDAVGYLNESKKAFPLLEDHKLLPEKAISFSPPKSTGMGEMKIIPATSANGTTVYAAMGERADGKGSYMFMMEAPEKFFQESEGTLDQMMMSMQAQE